MDPNYTEDKKYVNFLANNLYLLTLIVGWGIDCACTFFDNYSILTVDFLQELQY